MHQGWSRRSKDDASWARFRDLWLDTGTQVYRLDGAKRDHPGIPDALLVNAQGLRMVEVKAEDGELNPAQAAWHASYRGPPGSLLVVRTMAEALAARPRRR